VKLDISSSQRGRKTVYLPHWRPFEEKKRGGGGESLHSNPHLPISLRKKPRAIISKGRRRKRGGRK